MKKNVVLALAALTAVSMGCIQPKNSQGGTENDAQFIRAKGNPSKTLVAINVVPGANSQSKSLRDLHDKFVLSCGYELTAGTPATTKVKPLNLFAHSTPVADFNRATQEIVGGMITLYGVAAGAMLLVASPLDLDPDRGIAIAFGGVASWIASFFVGAPMIGGAAYDVSLNHQRANVFAKMTKGINETSPDFYKSNREAVIGSGNTPIPCMPQTAAELGRIIKATK